MEENVSELQFKVEQQIALLKANNYNTAALRALVDLYLKLENEGKAKEAVEQLFLAFDDNPKIPQDEIMQIIEVVVNYWRVDKYSHRGSMRLNISDDRKSILIRATVMLESILPLIPAANKQLAQAQLGSYRENLGRFQDALSLFSDLISLQQAAEIDLTPIIFRSAILLMHMGGNNTQAIEYLEYLADEPPEAEGYTRTHILACLAALYEKSGDHYAVVLEQTYQALQENYSKDLEKGKKPVTNQKKLKEQLTKKAFSRSSEMWEILAIQAVDRCDYVFAVQLTKKAIEKCPSKGSLSHLLAELHYLLGNVDDCSKAAERAFQLNPNSAELKNLLLLVNPDKWQDKMRTVAATREEVIVEDVIDHVDRQKKTSNRNQNESPKKDQSWLARITSSANEAIKDGLMAVANAKAVAEQKAKVAAEKERKRKERKEKREKEAADREARIKAMAAMGQLLTADGKPRKRDIFIDGPAKPEKPENLEAAKDVLDTIRSGNENVYLYDPILIQLAAIQDQIKREEMAWMERKKRLKQKGSAGSITSMKSK